MSGRYQLFKSTGNMMGMHFESMFLIGYLSAKKTFTSTWIDNFGTGTIVLEGTWDVQTKSMTSKGKMGGPGNQKGNMG